MSTSHKLAAIRSQQQQIKLGTFATNTIGFPYSRGVQTPIPPSGRTRCAGKDGDARASKGPSGLARVRTPGQDHLTHRGQFRPGLLPLGAALEMATAHVACFTRDTAPTVHPMVIAKSNALRTLEKVSAGPLRASK